MHANKHFSFPFTLNKNDRDEVRDLFARNNNEHLAWLHAHITAGSTDIHAFAQYGLSKLTGELDLKLSDFFFVLSSLSDLPKEVQDFFTEVMVFCEAQHTTYTSPNDVRARYEHSIAIIALP